MITKQGLEDLDRWLKGSEFIYLLDRNKNMHLVVDDLIQMAREFLETKEIMELVRFSDLPVRGDTWHEVLLGSLVKDWFEK